MRVLFAGTPAVAVPSLDALVAAGMEVVAVLTRRDAPTGRKRTLTASPVAERAEELGLPVLRANRIDADVTEAIAQLRLDAAAIVAYGGLIPKDALELPRHGWINLHFSLLPAWRGAAPVQHAIINGDEITGASTFRLEEGLDTGPVFGTLTEPVRPTDTSGDLLERLAHSGAVLLVQTLDALRQERAAAVPQKGTVSLAPKLSIADGRIDWNQPALAIRRRINGVSPEPGAWTELNGQRLKLGPVILSTNTGALRAAHVAVDAGVVLVGTGSQPVQLGLVQPAGKKMMPAPDWARGAQKQGEPVFS